MGGKRLLFGLPRNAGRAGTHKDKESGRGEGEDLPMVEEYREGACIIKVYDDAIRQPEEQEAIRKRVSKIAVKEEMGKYRQTQKED